MWTPGIAKQVVPTHIAIALPTGGVPAATADVTARRMCTSMYGATLKGIDPDVDQRRRVGSYPQHTSLRSQGRRADYKRRVE
jgi:hypothetical protein